MKISRQWVVQFARFALVGFLNTAVDIVIFNVLVFFFGLETPWYYFSWKSLAFLVAMVNSYFLNSRFTFRDQHKDGIHWWRFVMVTIATFAVSSVLSTICFTLLTTHTTIAVVLAGNISVVVSIGISMITNFVGYKFFVFKK